MKRFLQRHLLVWARRRQGTGTFPITLHRRRLYILPTKAGIAFAALLLFMVIAGLNYTNSLALFLTFLLAGFALAGMYQCHRNLLNLSLQGIVPLAAFAGKPAGLQLTLANDTTLFRHQIEANSHGAVVTIDLPARSTQRFELSLSAPKRGLIRIERLRLATTYPYGLFRAWTWVRSSCDVIIYPRPRGSLPMPGESGRQTGTHPRSGAGTEEWLGLRPFRDGDSPRQVDWKAYARGAALLVKEYSAAGSELRVFDFDQLPQLDIEARLEQLSRWVVDAEARGERYGLTIANHHIAPDRGPQHRHCCLTALALYGLETHK